jgi:translation initiation factor IF-2
VRLALEGMLAPQYKEVLNGVAEVRDTFHISRVGTVAGCMVLDGKIIRNSQVRLVRDGKVIYTGSLGSLKRFKDDAKEVANGFECGMNIDGYNDIKLWRSHRVVLHDRDQAHLGLAGRDVGAP